MGGKKRSNHSFKIFVLLCLLGFFFACSSGAEFSPKKEGGVLIYYKTDFDRNGREFRPSRGASLSFTEEAIYGKALEALCKRKWAGPALKIHITGSKALKIAFMAQGINFKRATLNFFDQKAHDNTTPYGYRFLPDGEWTPVLYYVDLFHYNSKNSGYIRAETEFNELRFWGPEPTSKKVILRLDNFVVYRGEDHTPPEKIKTIKANSTPEGIILSWVPPRDNVFPMVYVVSRATEKGSFKKIAETYRPFFKDKNVHQGVTYRYRVLACDFQNNLGPWSEVLFVTHKFPISEMEYHETVYERDRKRYIAHLREVHRRGKGKVNKGLVVLFGDSLTGPTLYPRLVGGALGIYRVKAYGFAGQTTGFGRRKVREILAKEKPEFLFVMFGTNNVRGKLRTQETYEKWVEDLIAIAKEAETEGVIPALATIPPRGFKDPLSLPEALFNKVLVSRAREAQIPIAYIFEAIQNAGSRREFIWKDGVHWTAKGMELAAWTWRQVMRQIEFALRDRP